jgi:glycyl-tRNA synthetase beta chain
VKGRLFPQHAESLLEQAVYSLECPYAVLGQFDALYLQLPQEVLITSMKEHQGFFAIVGDNGPLLSRFIAPTNMKLPNMSLIRKGNERVLSARLADAQYFFNEDQKRKLADRLDDLKGVIFHKKLGTLYQKSERMVALAPYVAEASDYVQDKESCQRAALLSKADLTTGMVGEFPTLQGIMGSEYARHDGEADQVCQALGEQYLPRNPDDPIPSSELGQLLSLIDRIDTLAAFFHAGVIPSGSEDPLGLRRQAFGLIRILVEGDVDINVLSVLRQSRIQLDAQVVGTQPDSQSSSEEHALLGFLAERIRYYGRTHCGFREDVMDVILDRPTGDSFHVRDLFLRMEALQGMMAEDDFEPLMIGFKRANRLVDKEQWTSHQVDSEIFEDSAESELFFAVDKGRIELSLLMKQGDYEGVLLTLLGLKPSIDQFFTAVLVNAPDAKVRANRLSLLSVVKQVFLEFGDFSKIQVQSNS